MKKLISLILILVLMGTVFAAAADAENEINQGQTLQYGNKGDEVKALQERLTELGYYKGKISGNYLEATQRAVRSFQADHGLEQTGIADQLTLSVLYSSEAQSVQESQSTDESTSLSDSILPEKTLRVGSRGDDVQKLQKRLTELNYYSGPVSGNYQKNTMKAVKAFQAANGLEQTGVADLQTIALLFSPETQSAPEPTPLPEPYQLADPGDEEPEGITFQGIPWCSSPEKGIQCLIDSGFIDEGSNSWNSRIQSLYKPESSFSDSSIYYDENSSFGYSIFCNRIKSKNRIPVPDKRVSTKLRKLEIQGKNILKTIAKQEIAVIDLMFSVETGTLQLVEVAVHFNSGKNVKKELDSALQTAYGKPVTAKKAQAGHGATAWLGDENTFVIHYEGYVVFAKMNKLEAAGNIEKKVIITPTPKPTQEKEDTGF